MKKLKYYNSELFWQVGSGIELPSPPWCEDGGFKFANIKCREGWEDGGERVLVVALRVDDLQKHLEMAEEYYEGKIDGEIY